MESTEYSGKGYPKQQVRWCLVYDCRNGNVVHIHQCIIVSTKKKNVISNKKLEAQAFEQATKKHGREFLKIVHPSKDILLDFNSKYQVDTQTGDILTEKILRSAFKKTNPCPD